MRVARLSLLLLLLPTLATAAPGYTVERDEELGMAKLVVKLRSKTLPTSIEDASVRVLAVRDFDGDGQPDALVTSDCGGNGCSESSHFVTVRNGRPVVAVIGHSFHSPKVIRVLGAQAVQLQTEAWTRTYTLRGATAVLVAEDVAPVLHPITEIKGVGPEYTGRLKKRTFSTKLKGDRKRYTVSCRIWDRWGSLVCTLPTPSGPQELSTGCDRFGDLPLMSRGRRMFVCGRDSVVRFDGKRWVVVPWPATR